MTTYALASFAHHRGVVVHRDGWGTPEYSQLLPDDYVAEHPRNIPLCMRHDPDWILGEIVHLEKIRGDLFAVAELNTFGVDILESSEVPMYFSAGTSAITLDHHGTLRRFAAQLREISLTPNPAHKGLTEVVWGEQFPYHGGGSLLWVDTWKRGVVTAEKRRHDRTAIEIYDVDFEQLRKRKPEPTLIEELNAAIARYAEPPTPVAYVRRHSFAAPALKLTEGRLHGRLVPYGVTTPVADRKPDGTIDAYREGFRRGAFRRWISDATNIATVELVHRHDVSHGLGYLGPAVNIEERDDGLHGEFSIVPSKRADVEALLADGVRELSIEFVDRTGGTTVDEDGTRWRTDVHLIRVALEARGAYPGAAVLAARTVIR